MTAKKMPLLAIALSPLFVIAPAHASDWGERVEQCAAAVEAEGLVDLSLYEAKFESGTNRRIAIELAPVAGGDALYAECKLSRGKVSQVNLKS